MTMSQTSTSTEGRDLIVTRIMDAPPEKVFRAWTEPELLRQWFVPAPWTIAKAETDVRPGGSSVVVMRSPEGAEFPNYGVYLEVVKNERIVLTDAYREAWEPSEKPFMTAIVTFEEVDGKTRYTAPWRTGKRTKRWAFMPGGRRARSNWPLWLPELSYSGWPARPDRLPDKGPYSDKRKWPEADDRSSIETRARA
jgi:uncharacterized protein YndB with AHSA1/START domain